VEAIVDPARDFGLHIFSRVSGDPSYRFPDKYLPHVVGSLSYPSVLTAYRHYRVFLNVNSVVESPSMCARRIFELLGCGASVLSGGSPAIEALLGPGLVWQSDAPERTHRLLGMLLANEQLRDRVALQGLRKVLHEHTYGHRFEAVLAAAGLPGAEPQRPLVSVLGPGDAVRRFAEGQRYERVEPIECDTGDASALNAAAERAEGELVAVVADGPVYGPDYLADLVDAFDYADAGMVGKRCTYARVPSRDWLVRRHPADEYRYVTAVEDATLVFRRAIALERPFAAAPGGVLAHFQRGYAEAGGRILSADRFNFVAESGPGDVDDLLADATLEAHIDASAHALA
jgi:hypothetical protein